jgi:hypothetical protein
VKPPSKLAGPAAVPPRVSPEPPAEKEVKHTEAEVPTAEPVRPEPLFGIKPPKQGVTLAAEEYPGLLGLVKPPKAPNSASSEDQRVVPGPQGKVGPAGRVRPPRAPYLSNVPEAPASQRPGPPRLAGSWAPAQSPVVHPTQGPEEEEQFAPARFSEPAAPPPPEPPEAEVRRRYEAARAAGDREGAAAAAEELARIYEASRQRQKAATWRHQAKILSS